LRSWSDLCYNSSNTRAMNIHALSDSFKKMLPINAIYYNMTCLRARGFNECSKVENRCLYIPVRTCETLITDLGINQMPDRSQKNLRVDIAPGLFFDKTAWFECCHVQRTLYLTTLEKHFGLSLLQKMQTRCVVKKTGECFDAGLSWSFPALIAFPI
jgi:hypothetical protein